MTSRVEFQARVDQSVTNFDILDQLANGGPDADVATRQGLVPTFAKLQKQNLLTSVAAEGFRDQAALAASTALAASRYYPTKAAGESASATGQAFTTKDGSGNLIVYERNAGGSAEIARALTPAVLAAPGGSNMIGFVSAGALSQVMALGERLSQLCISVTDKMTAAQRAAYLAGEDTYAAQNWSSAQTCINEVRARGGGTVLFPYPTVFWVDQPLEGESFIALKGASRASKIKKKGNALSNTTNVDCIVNFAGKREFSVSMLTLIGDRKKVNGVDQGTQHGLNLQGCTHWCVSEMTVDYCLDGYRFSAGNNGVINQPMAIRCSGYAFRFFGSQTTTVLLSPVAWGCAGGYSFVTAPYNVVIGSAADLISVGNRPAEFGGDPFGDSGGSYLQPKYIFELIGSPTSIVSPGTENSCAMWLYAEGTQSTILSPFVENMQAHTADWVFAQQRGPNPTHVTILNPSWRNTIANVKGTGPRAFVVETPDAQQFEPAGRWRIDSITAPGAYAGRGITASGSRRLVNMTQTSMVPGQDAPFIKPDVTDIAKVIVEGGVKKLQITAVSSATAPFRLPLSSEGMFNFNLSGSYMSQNGAAQIRLISIKEGANGNPPTETVIRQWTNDDTVISISDWVYAAAPVAPAMGRLELRITANATADIMKFDNFVIECSPRQQ